MQILEKKPFKELSKNTPPILKNLDNFPTGAFNSTLLTRKYAKILLKIYLRNSNNKTNLVLYLFQKLRETFPSVLTSSQTLYLANFDGTTDRVTSQSNERIDFYCNHKDTKMFAYIKFLCDNIHLNRVIIVSSEH